MKMNLKIAIPNKGRFMANVAAGDPGRKGQETIDAILPKLRKAGATGILVLPIERMAP